MLFNCVGVASPLRGLDAKGDLVGSRVSGQLPAVAQVRVEKGFRGYIGVILGLYRYYIGFYRDNGKENGNYYIIIAWACEFVQLCNACLCLVWKGAMGHRGNSSGSAALA